ncbi:hypothetical protein GOP47_0003372 [Adiantum capillus-veneris]|uniref:Pentatricopeptide repeat-containing protein n=1 Tax=Adiantum capillus-veneris TaxID=13818 RepID=A0A9D4VCN5_ADICA|nr:hypothetical protein GOP47_0003372 [Adiantum capillus-veneris]
MERKRTSLSFVRSLKDCAKRKDLYQGSRIHADICDSGLLEKNAYLGNMLVTMYVKCGASVRAKEVFDELPLRDVISWNALIAGYTHQGQGQEALGCFQQMQSEGFSPDAITYTCILKACGSTLDIDIGTKIHDDIASQGLLQKHVVLGTTLVDMYAKCGALQKAQKVLEELPVRNVVSWNALIAGYAQQEQGQRALCCFQRMQSEGLSPDAITYACILKACGSTQDADMGIKIHNDIVSQGLLQKNVVLGNALIDMYAKCGALQKAQKVLEELFIRDVVSWNVLIAGYVQQGQGQEALGCFQRMQGEGLSPDAITYACILKACGSMQDADMGTKIHDDIVSQGLLQKKVMLGNALVDMYAKCGALQKAQKVLEELPVRNVVSWNALIVGYAQQEQGQKALGCFQQMQSEGLSPDAITYACILKACGSMQDVVTGIKIHADIVNEGMLRKFVVLGNALVDMYAKCGLIQKAQRVLEELCVRDVVSWNALIAGYAQQGQGKEALDCFQQMRSEGLYPNAITFACILKACGSMQDADMGTKIHDDIVSQGLLQKNVVLGTALVDMYAKCGALQKAQKVLQELPVRNVVSWNALIAGYAQQEQGQKALGCFQRMQSEGLSPDAITYACILKACGSTQDADIGIKIHADIVSQGMLKEDVVLGNALVDMYAKCGLLRKAQSVLEELHVRDVVSWNALIAGYAQQGQGKEALDCFQQMRSEAVSPNAITYVCILKACGSTQDADMGIQIHDDIVSQGLLQKNVVLGNALVDMYAKCGALQKAQKVLEELSVWDVVSWNALIGGYAQQGQGREALGCFQRMQSEGLSPDAITYICILKACGSMQDADMGTKIHDDIVSQGLLQNNVELGNALVDMYAKCGALEKAQKVLEELPVRNVDSWNALIAGYLQQGQSQEALCCFQQMQSEGLSPNAITLKACRSMQDADMGLKIHADIASQGLLKKDAVLGNALVDMYAKCGALQKAQKLLEELPARNVDSWNALIAGYAEQGQAQEALGCFQRMQRECISPNPATYTFVLKAMLTS